MKLVNLGITLACDLGLAVAAQASPQHPQQDHAAAAANASVPIPAQRWATDAPLREGMGRIHTALDELRHYEMGHMNQTMALERVASIEEATRYLFANCKLAPDADTALHGMLGPLLVATKRLHKDPQDKASVAAIREAVADYPRYFDDPQWPVETGSADTPHDVP